MDRYARNRPVEGQVPHVDDLVRRRLVKRVDKRCAFFAHFPPCSTAETLAFSLSILRSVIVVSPLRYLSKTTVRRSASAGPTLRGATRSCGSSSIAATLFCVEQPKFGSSRLRVVEA